MFFSEFEKATPHLYKKYGNTYNNCYIHVYNGEHIYLAIEFSVLIAYVGFDGSYCVHLSKMENDPYKFDDVNDAVQAVSKFLFG